MTIYYVVPVPTSTSSVSGGTRKLFDHVAILNAHGVDAELLHNLPPAGIQSGPDNLFIFPEVYGEHLINALPPGVPRISMVQNGYLLDFDTMSPPKSPHPFLRCPDLVAVMVESQHTEDIVRERFPDLPCPIIRFTSSGNGRDGHGTGLHYGSWPRTKTVAYFEYKRQELNRVLFEGIKLPPGWSLRPIANMTDDEVAETLRTASIFAAPLTHEGLCATTQEALIAGAVVVAWPGGPSQFVPTGWPKSSTPVALTRGNTTVGGPMEYLLGRAQIAPQDDMKALRELIVSTAASIGADDRPWAARTEEWSRWHTEDAYSREQEVLEIVGIMRELTGTRHVPSRSDTAAVYEAGDKARALVRRGADGEAADLLMAALRGSNGRADHLTMLVECLTRTGRSPAELCAAVPSERVARMITDVVHLDPETADVLLEGFHLADPDSLAVLAGAAEVALRLSVPRRLVWSARLRARGLSASCPAVRAATMPDEPAIDRAVTAGATWASFADPRARQAFAAAAAELDAAQRASLDGVVAGIAPDLADLLLALPPAFAPTLSSDARRGARVVVVSRRAGALRANGLAVRLAAEGHRVTVLAPEPLGASRPLLSGLGIALGGWTEGESWQKDCLAYFVRHRGGPPVDAVILPLEGAKTLLPALRELLPGATLLLDADGETSPGLGVDAVLSSNGGRGTVAFPTPPSDFLPHREAVGIAARRGVCVLADMRDRPLEVRRAIAALLPALVATGAPVVVIGDDPEGDLNVAGVLRTGPLADPTPWVTTARCVVVAGCPGAAQWLELAAMCTTPALVVATDPEARREQAAQVSALCHDDDRFASFPLIPPSADRPDPEVLTALFATGGAAIPEEVRLLVDATELLADDRLLTAYGAAFSQRDPVTLLIYGAGLDAAQFEAALRALAARIGFDLEDGPEVMVLLPPTASPREEAEIAARVHARLSERAPWPSFAELDRIGADARALLELLAKGQASPPASSAPRLVSVLVPVYNHANYLAQCVDSVLAQSCADFELLLVDDRSTDGAAALAEQLAGRDARITFVQNDHNLGLVENHRRCLSMASGHFVKFLHADDRLLPNALERLVVEAFVHPEAPLVTSTRVVIDGESRAQSATAWTAAMAEHDTLFVGTAVGDFLLSTGLNCVGEPSTPLFRRGVITPEQFASYAGRTYTSLLDISTWVSVLSNGPLAYVAEPLSELRLHPGQYGHALGEVVQHIEWLALIADAHARGYLGGENQFTTALNTMATRLISAYLVHPTDAPEAVGEAITAALKMIAPKGARVAAAA